MLTESTAKRLLLIEDEPGLVRTLTDRLRSEGYEVQSASDGPTGLDRATRERWDVILLDVMLPGASGFDICRDLRQRTAATNGPQQYRCGVIEVDFRKAEVMRSGQQIELSAREYLLLKYLIE